MRSLVSIAALCFALFEIACRPAPVETTTNGAASAPRIETGSLDTAVVGARVSIRGRLTRIQDDSPYGHKLWVDDGTGEAQVFVDASSELIRHTNAWRVNDTLLVTGNVAKYQSVFEMLPRVPADVVVLERFTD
jgi:hypothetical protein